MTIPLLLFFKERIWGNNSLLVLKSTRLREHTQTEREEKGTQQEWCLDLVKTEWHVIQHLDSWARARLGLIIILKEVLWTTERTTSYSNSITGMRSVIRWILWPKSLSMFPRLTALPLRYVDRFGLQILKKESLTLLLPNLTTGLNIQDAEDNRNTEETGNRSWPPDGSLAFWWAYGNIPQKIWKSWKGERRKREKLSFISCHAGIVTHGASRSFLIRINSDTIPYFKAKTAEAIRHLSQMGSMAYRWIFFSPSVSNTGYLIACLGM